MSQLSHNEQIERPIYGSYHSSLTAITEKPQLIIQLFKTIEVQINGMYEIAVRINGQRLLVLVDN